MKIKSRRAAREAVALAVSGTVVESLEKRVLLAASVESMNFWYDTAPHK